MNKLILLCIVIGFYTFYLYFFFHRGKKEINEKNQLSISYIHNLSVMKNKLFLFLFYMMFSMTSFCQNSIKNKSSNVERDSRTLEKRVVGTFEFVKISNKRNY